MNEMNEGEKHEAGEGAPVILYVITGVRFYFGDSTTSNEPMAERCASVNER